MQPYTPVNVSVRIELFAPDGNYCGALTRKEDDIRMAGVPRAGEQIQIGWLPQYPGMPGWLTVDHVDHFPTRPWDAEWEAKVTAGPAAICVVRVKYPLDAPSAELRDAVEADGWTVWPVDPRSGIDVDLRTDHR